MGRYMNEVKPAAPHSPLPMQPSDDACLEFVNSTWADHLGSGRQYDRLPLPMFQAWFQGRFGLELDQPLGPAAVRQLSEMRPLMRRALEDWGSGRPPRPADVRRLDRALAAVPMVRRADLAGTGTRLVPVRRDTAWLMAELAASSLTLIATGDHRRLKVCGNEACSWMFLDESANLTRRWCDPAICGNLVKVRRFRDLRRQSNA